MDLPSEQRRDIDYAIYRGDIERLPVLLATFNEDVNRTNDNGRTMAHWAASNDRLGDFKQAVDAANIERGQRGAPQLQPDYNLKDLDGCSPEDIAQARRDRTEMAQRLRREPSQQHER